MTDLLPATARFAATARTLFGLVLLCATLCLRPAAAMDAIAFWDTPRAGANSFNAKPPDRAYFDALAATGATWVRLAFSKWPSKGKDFLVGDADRYSGLRQDDLATLRRTLDAAHAAGLKVVIAPLTLPGARYTQLNDGVFDDRLWSDWSYQKAAIDFWRELAAALWNHPAIVAYNILNEPAPEKTTGLVENGRTEDMEAWQARRAGTTRDLPAFYDRVIAAIREVDWATPIMLDGGFYANPRALATWPWRPADERLLYAFHMYEPWDATSHVNLKRARPLRYPGAVTEYKKRNMAWNRAAVAAHIGTAFDWAAAQGLPPTRVVAAEFGCMRRWADCGTYLSDVLDVIEARGGHWAFYAFREDDWDGMDYELPASIKPGRFYAAMNRGQGDLLPRNGQLMKLIRSRMPPS